MVPHLRPHKIESNKEYNPIVIIVISIKLVLAKIASLGGREEGDNQCDNSQKKYSNDSTVTSPLGDRAATESSLHHTGSLPTFFGPTMPTLVVPLAPNVEYKVHQPCIKYC